MIIVISKVISNDWEKILSGLSYLSKAKDKSKPSLVPSHTCHIQIITGHQFRRKNEPYVQQDFDLSWI